MTLNIQKMWSLNRIQGFGASSNINFLFADRVAIYVYVYVYWKITNKSTINWICFICPRSSLSVFASIVKTHITCITWKVELELSV